MRFFGSYRCKWWQVGIFKLALLTISVAIGAYWSELLGQNMTVVLIVAVLASVYILSVSLQQSRRNA